MTAETTTDYLSSIDAGVHTIADALGADPKSGSALIEVLGRIAQSLAVIARKVDPDI